MRWAVNNPPMTVLESPDTPVLPRPAGCPVPLTAAQLNAWNQVLKRGNRLSKLRLVATSVRLLGTLNVPALRRSIEAVIRRHESLRTRIVCVDGEPRQHIDTDCEFLLETIDLPTPLTTDAGAEAKRLAQEFIGARVDVAVGPLFAGKLLKFSDREHVFFLGLDHLVCDGTSNMILCREIWALYNQMTQQRPVSLPQLPVQFADYAVWQQLTLPSWLDRHDAYWRSRLTGAPYLQPPRDEGLNEAEQSTAPRLQIPLGKALTSGLRTAARRERVPLSSVVLTTVVAVLSRWCKQDNFVLGFVSHGRDGPGLANMIGYLATSLYIRVTVDPQESLIDLLRRIQRELQAAQEHRDHGRVPALYLKGSPGLFFNWVPTIWSPADWSPWSVRNRAPINDELETQPFPMELPLQETDPAFHLGFAPSDTTAGIVFTVSYRSDLFATSTLEWLFESIRRFSQDFAERPLAPLSSLSLAS